ncbi:unnamed protein product [Alopecurus aequalis]
MPVSAGWMSFDTAVGLDEELADNPTAASCATATGRVVRVSLRLESPPVPSSVRLYTDERVYGRPRVLAADGDLVLINMVLTVEDELSGCYPDNFLVYKADAHTPWLRFLPSPMDWIDDHWPWMPHLPRLLHRIGRRASVAIARSGEDFFVGSLTINYVSDNWEEVSDLLLYSSEKNMWEAKRLSKPPDPDKQYVNCLWRTDAVFSSGGFMCWVNYVRGILRYDLTSSMDSHLSFVRFPGIEIWDDEPGVPAKLRTVSVVGDRGLLKFLDVDNGRYRSTKNGRCTITTWILRMPELEWEKDITVQLDDLWSLPDYQDSPLPRIMPTYPVINGQDANIVHFVLDEEDKTWIITVDIRNITLRSYHLELDRMNQAMLRRKRVCGDVCKYLSNPSGN